MNTFVVRPTFAIEPSTFLTDKDRGRAIKSNPVVDTRVVIPNTVHPAKDEPTRSPLLVMHRCLLEIKVSFEESSIRHDNPEQAVSLKTDVANNRAMSWHMQASGSSVAAAEACGWIAAVQTVFEPLPTMYATQI